MWLYFLWTSRSSSVKQDGWTRQYSPPSSPWPCLIHDFGYLGYRLGVQGQRGKQYQKPSKQEKRNVHVYKKKWTNYRGITVQAKNSWASLSKLVWTEVSVILKSGEIVRNARNTALEMLTITHKNASQITQEILPSFLSTRGNNVILPGLIIYNCAHNHPLFSSRLFLLEMMIWLHHFKQT